MLKLQQPINKQVKYRFICKARDHLTKYNEQKNKEVEERCVQNPKFEPHLSCANHMFDYEQSSLPGTDNDIGMCPYLEVRKIG